MRKLTILLALSLSLAAGADVSNGRGKSNCHDATSQNIPVSYATKFSSLIDSLVSKGNVTVQNITSSVIAVSWSYKTCATSNADEMVVLPAASNTADHIYIPDNATLCVRSRGGSAVSAGTVCANSW